MPISMYQNGEYGHSGMFIGVPAIINRNGKLRSIGTLIPIMLFVPGHSDP